MRRQRRLPDQAARGLQGDQPRAQARWKVHPVAEQPLLPDEGGDDFAAGDDVTIALRPEKINLTRGVAKGPNQLDVTIEELGYLGSVTHVRVRTQEGIMLKILLSNRRRDEADFTWEDSAVASFDAKDAILLRR